MSARDVVDELGAYYKKSLDTKLKPLVPFEKKLRVSGFPYCGLKHAYETLDEVKAEEGDAMQAFYCGVGTAAHLVFQRWLGARGRIYGDWKCRNPKCGFVKPLSRKNVCPKCGSEMLYEELTVRYGKHVSGHVDGVFRASDGKIYVIDYKTSSTKVIYGQAKNPTFPYAKNKAQIESYCVLIEEVFNIRIEGWLLLYIARDNPKVFKIVGDDLSEKRKQKLLGYIKRFDKHYDLVNGGLTHAKLDRLIAQKTGKTREFCSEYISSCPLIPVCFSGNIENYMHRTLDDFTQL